MIERIVCLDKKHPLFLGILVPIVMFMSISMLFAKFGLLVSGIFILGFGVFSGGLAVSVMLFLLKPEVLEKGAFPVLSAVFLVLEVWFVFEYQENANSVTYALRFFYFSAIFVLTASIPLWLFRKRIREVFLQVSDQEWGFFVLFFLIAVTDSSIRLFQSFPFLIRFSLTVFAGFIGVLVVLGAVRPLFDSIDSVYNVINGYFVIAFLVFIVKIIVFEEWSLGMFSRNEQMLYHSLITFPFYFFYLRKNKDRKKLED